MCIHMYVHVYMYVCIEYIFIHIHMYVCVETLQSVTAEHLCLLQNIMNDGNMYMYVCLCMC